MGETVRTLVIIIAAIGVADVLDMVFYRHNWRWFVKGVVRVMIYPFLILANGKSVADRTLRVNRR